MQEMMKWKGFLDCLLLWILETMGQPCGARTWALKRKSQAELMSGPVLCVGVFVNGLTCVESTYVCTVCTYKEQPVGQWVDQEANNVISGWVITGAWYLRQKLYVYLWFGNSFFAPSNYLRNYISQDLFVHRLNVTLTNVNWSFGLAGPSQPHPRALKQITKTEVTSICFVKRNIYHTYATSEAIIASYVLVHTVLYIGVLLEDGLLFVGVSKSYATSLLSRTAQIFRLDKRGTAAKHQEKGA